MSRTMQCANVQTLENAHSHSTPTSCTPTRTLEQQTSLKALAGAVLGRTLPSTISAHSAQEPCTLPAQNAREWSGNVQPLPDDLEQLIRRVGTRQEFTIGDFLLMRDLARRNPDGLRLALESDNWLAGAESELCGLIR